MCSLPALSGQMGRDVCYMASTVDHIYIDCMNKASERYKVIKCARKNNNSTCSSNSKMWAPTWQRIVRARIHSASYHLPEVIFDMIFSTLGSNIFRRRAISAETPFGMGCEGNAFESEIARNR